MTKQYITWKSKNDDVGYIRHLSEKTLRTQFQPWAKEHFPMIFKEPKIHRVTIRKRHQCAYCGWGIPRKTRVIKILTCGRVGCSCNRKAYHENCGLARYAQLPAFQYRVLQRLYKTYKQKRLVTPADLEDRRTRNKDDYDELDTKDDVLYNVESELNFTYHYGENDYDDGLNCVHYDIVTNSITKFRTSSSSQEYSRRLDSEFEVSVTHERYCTKFECWCHGRDDNDEYDIP